jgi:hypothetical protein
MKTKEAALTEWSLGEIQFQDPHGTGQTVFDRTAFRDVCEIMRGRGIGMSVPLLHDTMTIFRQAARSAGWSEAKIDAALDSFFSPENLLRCTSVYEVKEKLRRKISALQCG